MSFSNGQFLPTSIKDSLDCIGFNIYFNLVVLVSWYLKVPSGNLVYCFTELGIPFKSAKGFENFLSKAIEKAGLSKNCVPHGLRKAGAKKLAEAGGNRISVNGGYGMDKSGPGHAIYRSSEAQKDGYGCL